MPNNWTVAITHYNVTTTTTTDLTENFVSLPQATDTGTSEVNSARLILSAPLGKFITVAPLLNQFDRIRILITDDDGNTYNKIFDITKIIPTWTKSEGIRVTLMLLGIEHWLQKINHVKPFFYEGAYEVVKDVGDLYNANKGTLQPALTGHDNTAKNKLPSANYQKNNYDFAVSEAPCFERIGDVVDKLGASASDGGILDFYEGKINSDVSSYTTMELEVFSGGSPTSGSEVTLNDTTSVNVGESESGIDSITGSIIHAWGAVDQGSIPINISQYNSKSRRRDFLPQWISTENYKIGSVVLYLNSLYTASADNSGSIPSSFVGWTALSEQSYYAGIVYSPWTLGVGGESGSNYWKDSGLNPSNNLVGNQLGNGFYDSNVIVHDEVQNFFRIKVDMILTTTNPKPSDITASATLKKYLYNDDTFFRGFTVLLKNTTTSTLWSASGTSLVDRNNKAYSQAVLKYTGSEWIVKYLPVLDETMVVVRDEGLIYVYNGTTWAEPTLPKTTEFDCMHQYDSIANTAGIPITHYSPNNLSAVTVTYDFTSPALTDGTHYKAGAWLNMSFPFPTAKINHTTSVGTLYGGATTGRDAVAEPATFDAQNMHLTHDGYRGFNNGESSEDYGQISSLDFWLKIHFQADAGEGMRTVTEPNYKMRCTMIDTSDNVVIQDFVIGFNNHWEQFKLPISGFTAYRATKPAKSVVTLITPPKQIKIMNTFEFKNIKDIIIQTQESYDEFGRYVGNLSGRYINYFLSVNYATNIVPLINRRIELSIDAFHFTKPLLVNTGADTSRCYEGEFIERPEIMDYYQLKSDAAAELEKRKWRHVEFDITTTGKTNINFGDFFFYENATLIPTEFKESATDKIKLVAKHIEYSITKPVAGKGGFLRRILGVKRF